MSFITIFSTLSFPMSERATTLNKQLTINTNKFSPLFSKECIARTRQCFWPRAPKSLLSHRHGGRLWICRNLAVLVQRCRVLLLLCLFVALEGKVGVGRRRLRCDAGGSVWLVRWARRVLRLVRKRQVLGRVDDLLDAAADVAERRPCCRVVMPAASHYLVPEHRMNIQRHHCAWYATKVNNAMPHNV